MTNRTHISGTPSVARSFLYLVMLLLALFSARPAAGQTSEPDTVCVGMEKKYWVTGSPGSTYTWKVNDVLQSTITDTIYVTWIALGDNTLKVIETTADNCIGDEKVLPVYVKYDPPTFIAPVLESGYCVENITQAIYNPNSSYYIDDLSPPRPDYFLLPAGSSLLDYTIVVHDCPGTLAVTWMIDFAGSTPNLSGSGQISSAILPEGMRFPIGTNTITWTIMYPNGSTTTETVSLIVFPRPDIGDITY